MLAGVLSALVFEPRRSQRVVGRAGGPGPCETAQGRPASGCRRAARRASRGGPAGAPRRTCGPATERVGPSRRSTSCPHRSAEPEPGSAAPWPPGPGAPRSATVARGGRARRGRGGPGDFVRDRASSWPTWSGRWRLAAVPGARSRRPPEAAATCRWCAASWRRHGALAASATAASRVVVRSPGHVPLRRGDVHRRGGGDPPPVRHQPRPAGVRPGQPARGGQGRPVRPLLALGQEPAAAVPRRVRGRPRRARRRDGRRHRRPAPGRGALRAGLLRVRRRLGGPARRGAPGLRAGVQPADQGPRAGPAHGVPRAVDPLHRLRQPAATGHYRYYRPPEVLDSPLGARYVGDMDRMFDTYGDLLPRMQTWLAAPLPERPGDSDFVHRQAVRAKALDALRGLLPGGLALQRRHLRHRPVLRAAAPAHAGPPAARGPPLRRA